MLFDGQRYLSWTSVQKQTNTSAFLSSYFGRDHCVKLGPVTLSSIVYVIANISSDEVKKAIE